MSITIDFDLCESTGCCSMVCPEDVLEFENGHTAVADPQGCTACWICVDHCAAGAIVVD